MSSNLPTGLSLTKVIKPSTGEHYPTWYFRIRRTGLKRQLLRNTGTADKREAERIARLAYKAVMAERWEAIDATALRRTGATVGQLIDAYLGSAQICSPETARKNANDLLLILRLVNGWPDAKPDERRASNERARSLPLTAIDRELAFRYYSIRQGRPDPDFRTRSPENRGINSTLNNARGLFSKNARDLIYHDRIPIPDCVDGFLTLRYLPTPRKQWEPIPEDAYQAMVKAADQLKTTDPELWLINQLIRRLGLRTKELLHARSTWLEDRGGTLHITVTDRPDEGFELKGVRSRTLPVAADLAPLLRTRSAHLVCPGQNKAQRERRIRRDHNKFLRQFIRGRAQANHELRKHIGSVIYTLYGADAATDYLGHVNPQTTRNHYQARLDQLPTVTDQDISTARLATRTDESAGQD